MPEVGARHLQDQDSVRREEQEHRADLASDRDSEQWQQDQLSRLSTPELYDRWASTVREFWTERETPDYRNGSPIAAVRATDLETKTNLLYAEMQMPERTAALHELEQAPPWIEQGLSY
jgi:hypothetical protein